MFGLDDFLVDRIFNPFAKRFNVLTGKSCYFLAQMSFMLSAAISVAGGVYGVLSFDYTPRDECLLIVLSFISSYMFIKSSDWPRNEQKRFERKGKVLCTSRIDHQMFRIGLLILIPIIAYSIRLMPDKVGRDIFSFICLTIAGFDLALYFFACTPLPPGESKIGEFATNFKAFFAKRELQKVRYK